MLKCFSNSLRRLHKELRIHGFSSAMNFIIFFIYIPLVHSASHTFMTTYTRLNGQTIAGTPEISSVTTLDGEQIDYYDSDTGTLIPKQDWMKEFRSGDRFKEYTEIRERVQQTNKRFSQSHGVHMYRRMYGCDWDDQTEVSQGFDEYDYDGQRFISLDLKEGRYTAHVQQADPSVQEWNNDRERLDVLKQYYKHECIDWLKEFLIFSKATSKKTGIVTKLPGQSLTEPIQNNLTMDDPKSNGSASDASNIMLAAIISIIILVIILILLYVLWKYWDQLIKHGNGFIYYKEVDRSSPKKKTSQSPPPKFLLRALKYPAQQDHR